MVQLSVLDRAGMSVPADVRSNGINSVLEFADLAWNVEQKPIHSDYGVIPNLVANYRDDTHEFLGTVSPNKYKVVQNTEAFSFIDQLDNFQVEKVGSFQNGKKVFVVGKEISTSFEIEQNDKVDMYLTFVHGHDGLTAIRVLHCPIRMFCMNQMNMMLDSSDFKFSTKHTGDIGGKLEEIRGILQKGKNYMQNVQKEVQVMLNKPFNGDVDTFLERLFPIDDSASTAQRMYNNGVKQTIRYTYMSCDNLQNFRGTCFGMYSAVSDFISHIEPQRRTKNSNEADANLFIKSLEGNETLERCHLMLMEAA